MKQNITITDIAREAGVSIATVSRVLNGKVNVASEKKDKIEAIIKKYDFHPNALARGLINTRAGIIGMITADIRNLYYSSLYVSCETAAAEQGYNLILCNSYGEREKEFELLEKLAHQNVDAIILLGGAVDDVNTDPAFADRVNAISQHIPFVITGHLTGTSCTQVNINTVKAMTIVMQYLSKNPLLKKIALIGGTNKAKNTLDLRTCFQKMLKQADLEYLPAFDIQNGRYDMAGGYHSMNHLLADGHRPDAVIAVNDFTAIGAYRSIQEHKLSIPSDISLISFDNTYLCTITQPPLTSVSYNYQLFGKTIIDNALALIDGKEVPQETLITPELIIRES